ncbi:hypothetical protein [Chryseobacterium limigenitum]|uniref:WxL domain-containing protein n=1 Tax=Chryseobacterium limigenitum TaxID=1612149 RepID=A0A1K2IYT9_9FLAO|nr:hypothetical protein [Chryseobacterium limigenitum]SFZ96955.1 hypothetical protein SAMN05216324_13114 [Chryseobacterium limigenitum]
MRNKLSAAICCIAFFNTFTAQVGINTSAPQGTFHVDGNKDNSASPTATQQQNDFIVNASGATGIGITTLDSSAKLQIESTDKGVLIPRVTLTSTTDATTISSPAKGLMVYNTTSNAAIEEGFYVNYGTSLSPSWRTYEKRDKTLWKFENFYDISATATVDENVSSGTTVNNIDLGLSITVTIPAFTQAKLVTTYSVPTGTTTAASTLAGYYGIRFLKGGAELPEGSRKYTIPNTSTGVTSRMVSVGATIGDTIVNNTASSVTVTYALNGYVEPSSGSGTIRFNMWQTPGANFNWGKSYMSIQMYTKPTN